MSKFFTQKPIILASGSASRQHLLQSLAIDFTVIPSNYDESFLKNSFVGTNFSELARQLAENKALAVSINYPSDYIIAGDQLCVIGEQYLDKPGNHLSAVSQLKFLQGKTHQQIAACCIAKAGKILWEVQDIAMLTMHLLSDKVIEQYLQSAKPYQSCGAYHYEGQAKWLFKNVQGCPYTIMGLPLTVLTNALIAQDIVRFN